MKLKWIILIVVALLLVASVGGYLFIKGDDECRMDFQCESTTFNDPVYGETEVESVCCYGVCKTECDPLDNFADDFNKRKMIALSIMVLLIGAIVGGLYWYNK